jgi:hypothetical protein
LVRIALSLTALACLLAPSAAAARDPAPWATVNVCDTGKQPGTVGIRAAMPGTPKGVRLSMRFRVQYKVDETTWADVKDADSGWRVLGEAKGVPAESGWSFTFAKPSKAVTLRGVVRFRWRKGDQLPRTTEVATEAGHRSSAGADPDGYSAATCSLEPTAKRARRGAGRS